MLEADGHAEEVLGGASLRAFDAGAVLDQAVGAAEAGGANEELAFRGDAERGFLAAADLEGEHAAEGGHLARGDFVAGVIGESGVVHLFDGVVGGVWHQKRSGTRVAITVEPLDPLTRSQGTAVEAEVGDRR